MLKVLESVAVILGVVVAATVYVSSVYRNKQEDERRASEKYLSEAIRILERAYEAFTDDGATPANDRLLWLSVARMIVRFQKLIPKVTSPEHINIMLEHEEFWRLQFYTVLQSSRQAFTREYFQPGGDPYGGDTVARSSIAVIFSFARWPEGREDPLDEVDDRQLFAEGAVPIDFFGLIEALEQYPEYWADVRRRMAEGRREA